MSFTDSVDLSDGAISEATDASGVADIGSNSIGNLGDLFSNVTMPSTLTPTTFGTAVGGTTIGSSIQSLASDATKAITSIFNTQAQVQMGENNAALLKAQGAAAVAKASQPPVSTNMLLLIGAGLAGLMIFSNGKK